MLKALARKHWDFTTAAHLLNRAGFGGTPKEIDHLAGRQVNFIRRNYYRAGTGGDNDVNVGTR